ncbi:MAG: hypothetical protein HRU78_15065 [Gammaproteobacteria bacterium]|nr:MAG: hypothetical protein HRU78_15065 [Gammaproteobacteria bacterium]
MNKYEKLFAEIAKKTEKNEIEWKQVKKSAHADLIFNPDMVFRQYSGELKKGNDTYEVVFLEKKTDDPVHDFAYQRYIPEIMIIDDKNELLVTITDSVIEKDDMLGLLQDIEEKNDRVKKLFD